MLKDERCIPCRNGVPRLSLAEARQLLHKIPGWRAIRIQGVTRLRKEFSFDSYLAAAKFVGHLAHLSEKEDHHPEIVFAWGRVVVSFWTHKIRGLHRNDAVMAAKTNALYFALKKHEK